jgi:hypothetical protein
VDVLERQEITGRGLVRFLYLMQIDQRTIAFDRGFVTIKEGKCEHVDFL